MPTLLRTRQSMCSDDTVRFVDQLSQARGGDVATLGKLLDRYRNYLALLSLASRSAGACKENGSGFDLVQDTFLEAHRDFPHFRGQSEGELVKLAHRRISWFAIWPTPCVIISALKDATSVWNASFQPKLTSRRKVLDRGLMAPISSPSHQASEREQVVLLADALGRLQEGYREAIILRHLEGLTFPEVAQVAFWEDRSIAWRSSGPGDWLICGKC